MDPRMAALSFYLEQAIKLTVLRVVSGDYRISTYTSASSSVTGDGREDARYT
jgi:hypothetical protein